MSFIEYLRDRNVKDLKHPVSFGFSTKKWEEYFAKYTDGSEEDKKIRDFGLFIFWRLEKVRGSLSQIQKQTPYLRAP